MVLSLENLSCVKMFLFWFLNGKNLLWLVDMHLEINTELLILLLKNPESLKWYLLLHLEILNKLLKFSISLDLVVLWECIIWILLLLNLLINASNMLWIEIILFISLPKILLWRNMMVDSKIFSKISMIINTKLNLKPKDYGMNIDLLMIWLLMWSNLMVDLYGLAKIMMVMFNLIL